MGLLAALLAILTAAAAVRILLQRRRRSSGGERWRELAPRLELTLEPGTTRLTGRYRGRELELSPTPRGWAEVRTRVRAPLPRGMHLLHRDTQRLLGVKGLRDSRIGDPEFDRDVVVHSDHPAAVIRLLREERARAAVHTLLRETPHAHVVAPDVYVRLPPAASEPDVRAALRRVCEAADALEDVGRATALQAEEAKALVKKEAGPGPSPRWSAIDEAFLEQRDILAAARRWRAWTYAATGGFIGLGTVLFFAGTALRRLLPPLLGFRWQLIGLVLGWIGASAFGVGVLTYRCPGCRQRVKTVYAAPDDREFGATSCPNCGVRLR